MLKIAYSIIYKARKSVATNGVAATVVLCLSRPFAYLARPFSRKKRLRRRQEREFELQFGVDTRENDDFSYIPDVESPNWSHGLGYQPTPANIFREMMNEVSIPYENFIFIDCGSGKGAVLLLASDYPFKKIIGVEYCKALHAAATRNLAVYQSPTRKCTDIQCVCADATAFPIPPEPAVLYFYNPFDEVLMHQVVGVIEQSRNAVPRKLIVIYFNPVHGDAFRDSGLWTEIVKRETYVIFESRG